MAAGDLVVADYQVEFWRNDTDRVLLGPTTNYPVLSLRGLDIPSVRAVDFEYQSDDGVFFPLRDLLQPRKLQGSFLIQGNIGTQSAARIDDLVRILRPADFSMICTFRIPGRANTRILGRPRRLAYDKERLEISGVTPADFEFVAGDPTIYSQSLESVVITLGAGVASQSETFFHDGTYLSPPTFTIVGPATNPRLTNVTYNNKQIKVDYALLATDTLVIDVLNRTVKLNGADRYDLVRNDNQWWEILPGQQTISYSRTGTTGSSTMTMQYRRAFVAV